MTAYYPQMLQQPAILYKYLPAERIDFFAAPKVRFTPPKDFDDIFDSYLHIAGVFREEELAHDLSQYAASTFEKFYDQSIQKDSSLTQEMRVILDDPRIKKLATSVPVERALSVAKMLADLMNSKRGRSVVIRKMADNLIKLGLGILCLTSDYKNSIMWGLYARGKENQAHGGFAVGFDTTHSFFERRIRQKDSIRHLVPVRYRKKRKPRILLDYEKDESRTIQQDMFYTKNIGWAFEKEWRMVNIGYHSKNNMISGLEAVPIEIIKGIYLGTKSDVTLQEAAHAFCKNHKIPLHQIIPTVDGVLESKNICSDIDNKT